MWRRSCSDGGCPPRAPPAGEWRVDVDTWPPDPKLRITGAQSFPSGPFLPPDSALGNQPAHDLRACPPARSSDSRPLIHPCLPFVLCPAQLPALPLWAEPLLREKLLRGLCRGRLCIPGVLHAPGSPASQQGAPSGLKGSSVPSQVGWTCSWPSLGPTGNGGVGDHPQAAA